MNINENIKKARKAAGITQKELAEMIGVHQKDISRWENGERTPNIEAFSGICKALKTSADTLLELEIGKD
jgi:transcriptional regulator with XRE-family HTH domain